VNAPAVARRPAAPPPARPPAPLGRDLLATVALAAYSAAVAGGFARVFSGWDFLGDLLLLVVVGHATSFALRRLRVSGWLAAPAVTVVLLWLLLAISYRSTFTGPFPRGATWDLLDLELGLVREQFPTAVAPVIYDAGWALLAGLAIVVVVAMADAFAFHAQARGESLVPGGVLFVFISALGSDRDRVFLTALLIGAGVLAVVALRQLHDRTRRITRDTRRSVSMLVPAAVLTAVVVGALAGIVGTRLPGAHAEPLYDTKGRGNDVTEVVSPLVDIRSRLTSRGNSELFRVNADREAYWRVTTLPEFDGSQFGLPSRALERVEGGEAFEPANGPQIRQQLQVIELGGQLVPAAADPFQASGESAAGDELDLRLNRDTSTLLTPAPLAPGDLFTVVSATPELTPDTLRAAGSANPPDELFVGLPGDLPGVVAELAQQVAGSAPNSYDAAIALQNWFRSEFTYSLEVQSGHSNDAIEQFLDIRVGYCEQFAGTFAAMARTLGIPTRVAVGYTPGILGADGWYSVRGRNAHAWPEVWFDGVGWVAFEPTPGRGAPGAENYTGLPAAQDTTVDAGGPGPGGGGTVPIPTAPATVVPPDQVAPRVTIAPDPGRGPTDPDAQPQVVGPAATDDDDGGLSPLLIVYLVVALLVAAPWAIRRVRRVRHQGTTDQIVAAWRRAQQAAIRAGVAANPAMTSRQWAAATASVLPVAARPMSSLAEIVDQVSYARPGSVDVEHAGSFGETLAEDCELWSRQVLNVANEMLTTRQKIWRYFTDFT